MERDPATLPRCLLFLVQGTASMSGRTFGSDCQEVVSKFAAALELVRRVLAGLPTPAGGIDLAVLVYTGGADRRPVYHSLLPETTLDRPWLSSEHVQAYRIALEQPRWPWPIPTPTGEALASSALATATLLSQQWLTESSLHGSPIVVHLLDDQAIDASLIRIARSLRCLATPSGPTILAHALFTSQPVAERRWPAPDDPLPRGLQIDANRLSSKLPGNRCAWSVNALPVEEILELLCVSGIDQPTRPTRRNAWSLEHRVLTEAKEGNTAEENEDASDVSPSNLAAAVADGASFGIFSRSWARLLCSGSVTTPERFAQPTDRDRWLAECRTRWLDGIPTERMTVTKQRKIQAVGSGATLLLFQAESGLLYRRGQAWYRWRAWAVGDSCLFWIRRNRLLASFPGPNSGAFGLSTPLLRTLALNQASIPLHACGLGKVGDFFLLATDALALMFLQLCEAGELFDWSRFWDLSETAWQQELETYRNKRLLVNDDCTLLAVQIVPRAPDLGVES